MLSHQLAEALISSGAVGIGFAPVIGMKVLIPKLYSLMNELDLLRCTFKTTPLER
jgi:hypothetical protein